MRPVASRTVCGCCANLRLPAWWTPGFARTCGLMRQRRRSFPAPPAPSDGENMKALVFKRYGGSDHIAFADTSRPVPRPDEILVQVHAAGLNPIDCAIPKGTF